MFEKFEFFKQVILEKKTLHEWADLKGLMGCFIYCLCSPYYIVQ